MRRGRRSRLHLARFPFGFFTTLAQEFFAHEPSWGRRADEGAQSRQDHVFGLEHQPSAKRIDGEHQCVALTQAEGAADGGRDDDAPALPHAEIGGRLAHGASIPRRRALAMIGMMARVVMLPGEEHRFVARTDVPDTSAFGEGRVE